MSEKKPNKELVVSRSVTDTQKQIEVLDQLMPIDQLQSELEKAANQDSLKQYIKDISRYKLLTPEEESQFIKQLTETGDIEAAKALVRANLRLVVKIAFEYRSAYSNVLDLIQEGNIGLMKAVSKYEPDKGAKLSYYASWWIKSYILKFILDNFRLIKIGTTADQKKLFYNLMKEKDRLVGMGIEPDSKLIADNLGVSEKAVIEMDARLGPHGGEVSIDRPYREDQSAVLGDTLAQEEDPVDERLSELQSLEILEENLQDFLSDLNERDRDIFSKRLLQEVPPSLQSIADTYGVSRERIRQIESRLLDKLKLYMSDYLS